MTIPDDRFEAGGAKGSSDGTDTRGLVQIPESNPTLPSRATVENPYDVLVALLDEPEPLAVFIRGERARIISAILAGNTFGTEAGHNLPCNNTHCQSIPVSGMEMSRNYSDLIDAVVRRMFEIACNATGANPLTLQMAIVATGGYGRRELAPFSDIDLTFIPQRDGDAATDRVVRELFRLVTDVFIAKCGLEIGYAYRLLSDCTALDHQTASGLLDSRYITGSQRLFIRFEAAFWYGFNAPEFVFAKIDERNAVLKKHGMLPRCVEPNLKEGPGGLRDIHTAVWLVQARNHLAATRVRGNRGLGHLVGVGELNEKEVEKLVCAKEMLFKVRNAMHAVSGAERDQLVVTRQEDVAAALGYVNSETANEDAPPVERFMADLFPALAACRRISDRVMRAIGNSRLLLGIGLDCVDRKIITANDFLTNADPVWMAWACELAQRYNLALSDNVQAKASELTESHVRTRQPDELAMVFTQMLCRIGSVYSTLQTMADLGILAWILPEFGRIMDLIPYDASHDYTVGQHTLLVVRNLENLVAAAADTAEPEEQAEMRRTLQELPNPEYLMLAALLHDTGKSKPGSPHAELSAQIADRVCKRLKWSPEAAGHVRFLVLNHQLMGDTSRLRDLNMERTIRDFVSVVDDLDRLNMLYLLTYADTRAVGEGIKKHNKIRFLRELWQRAASAIYDQDGSYSKDDSIADARRKIKRDLTLEKIDPGEIEEHIEAMPPYYLLNSTQQEVALHIDFVRRVRRGEIVLEFHDERAANYTEITVCIVDDPTPGLLSKIAAALLASSLNVHSARVVTRATARDRIALDTLLVDYKGKPLSPGKRKEISTLLTAVLGGSKSISDVLPVSRAHSVSKAASARYAGRTPQQARPLTIELVSHDFDHGVSFLEVSGTAALDLFYRICGAVSAMGWDIQAAKLSAARDVMRASLYVTGARQMTDGDIKRRMVRSLEGIPTTRA